MSKSKRKKKCRRYRVGELPESRCWTDSSIGYCIFELPPSQKEQPQGNPQITTIGDLI